jgi:arsenate reductase
MMVPPLGDRPMRDTLQVLFLCTGNSARSVMAEAILNRLGAGRFEAHSAGSLPKGEVHPHTLALLSSLGYSTQFFRSKSWDEFVTVQHPLEGGFKKLAHLPISNSWNNCRI